MPDSLARNVATNSLANRREEKPAQLEAKEVAKAEQQHQPRPKRYLMMVQRKPREQRRGSQEQLLAVERGRGRKRGRKRERETVEATAKAKAKARIAARNRRHRTGWLNFLHRRAGKSL